MESGFCCMLDPAGGNEVNFRAVLRAAELKWGQPASSAVAAEAEAEGSNSDDAPPQQPTRGRNADDYDYDDDFIDDEELFQHDAIDTPMPVVDSTPLLFEPNADLVREEPLPVVRAVDSSFYVNRGEIRPGSKIDALVRKARTRTYAVAAATIGTGPYVDVSSLNTTVPLDNTSDMGTLRPEMTTVAAGSSKKNVGGKVKKNATAKASSAVPKNGAEGDNADVKGNNAGVSVKAKANSSKAKGNTKSGTQAKERRASNGEAKSALPSKRPLKQSAVTIGGKLSKSATSLIPSGPVSAASAVLAAVAGESAVKKRKTESAAPKPLPSAVSTEVQKLRVLCTARFGDKKPNLLDGEVQAQVRTIFVTAVKHNLTKLHSDLKMDNRVLKLSDELWSALSKFLRTTRPYIEQLGHALHWKVIEDDETAVVEAAQRSVAEVVTALGGDESFKMEVLNPKLVTALQHLLVSRTKLHEAKNQLAARYRSVKKVMPSWAMSLKKAVFPQSSVTDLEFINVLKNVEEINAAEAKRKKDEEKDARRKKREEKAAQPKQGLPPGLRNLASLKAKSPSSKQVAKNSTAAAVSSAKTLQASKTVKKARHSKTEAKRKPKVQSVPAQQAVSPKIPSVSVSADGCSASAAPPATTAIESSPPRHTARRITPVCVADPVGIVPESTLAYAPLSIAPANTSRTPPSNTVPPVVSGAPADATCSGPCGSASTPVVPISASTTAGPTAIVSFDTTANVTACSTASITPSHLVLTSNVLSAEPNLTVPPISSVVDPLQATNPLPVISSNVTGPSPPVSQVPLSNRSANLACLISDTVTVSMDVRSSPIAPPLPPPTALPPISAESVETNNTTWMGAAATVTIPTELAAVPHEVDVTPRRGSATVAISEIIEID